MKLLDKQTVLYAIDAAFINNKNIGIIDKSLDNPYVSGSFNYDGVTKLGQSIIVFHYSIFHKIFPEIFKLFPMNLHEQSTWRALMAICLIKKVDLSIGSSMNAVDNFFDVIQIGVSDYLILNLEQTNHDSSKIQKILVHNDSPYTYEYFNHEDLLNCLFLPLLNNEAEQFELSFKSADDLTDEILLILSALSL